MGPLCCSATEAKRIKMVNNENEKNLADDGFATVKAPNFDGRYSLKGRERGGRSYSPENRTASFVKKKIKRNGSPKRTLSPNQRIPTNRSNNDPSY